MNIKEEIYIFKRKLQARLNSMVFYLCRIFSIDDNLITVCTFEGRGGFGCNQKYIVEELHRRYPDYKIVWFVNDMSKEFPTYINKVENTLWNRAYWLSRSCIWLDNYRKPYGTIKRKGQLYINTWHATISFKAIGLWRGKAFSPMAYLVSKNDSDMIDRVVIDSEYCAEMYPKGMIYDGEYLRVGTARCDNMSGDRSKWQRNFRNKFNLPHESKIVMYAPTFRESAENGKRSVSLGIWSLDFVMLLDNMEKRFGGTWYLCMRVHPQLAPSVKEYKNALLGDRVIDASQEDDLYEILPAIDALVTDYSSIAMDASLSHIPVFIYADDLEQYMNDRGGMQWDFSRVKDGIVTNNKEMTPNLDLRLPYPVATDNAEMSQNILEFDVEKYERELTEYERECQLIFDGQASKKIVDFIRDWQRV